MNSWTELVHHHAPGVTLFKSDALRVLRTVGTASVDCVVTSPPYWGMRDYGADGQYGMEPTVEDYAASLRRVFAEVKRVLTPTGTCWVNLGDSYGGSWGNYVAVGSSSRTAQDRVRERRHGAHRRPQSWMPRKSLIGLPRRVAFAMRQDGWLLRSAVVWHKPNAAPESVRDRFSTSYETVFLFAASDRHYLSSTSEADLWSVPVRAYRGAHNAVGPVDIAAKAIELGCPRRGVVLDPFSGTATTGVAARALGHRYIGIDLNPAFHDLAIARFAEQEGETPWQPSR
ncbi:DNA-methyltransferase [Lentzea flava]|nr:site-specific DNA-methyltransferase [Lentzea flava]MCP2200381.1 site-specific DNA-methyltransferase (adenine-specific) [Lentzea flava]